MIASSPLPPYTPPPPALADRLALAERDIAALQHFAALLAEWTVRINLVARSQLAQLWLRHIWDSAQGLPHLPPQSAGLRVDIGSGAGFPGLILAILDRQPTCLVESDSRKCAFLRTVVRELDLTAVTVRNCRIETLTLAEIGQKVALVTARALAPLSELLGYAYPLVGKDGECLFWKGENYQEELTLAAKAWNMTAIPLPSLTGAGALWKIGHLRRETL